MAARKKTPAEIPAEANAAQRTSYHPLLLLDEIVPHPKNIRHDATADAELVASIAEQGLLQPLVVAPAPLEMRPNAEVLYILIAGHRRLDGLKRAGYSHAPAIVRRDLTEEADQIAAMLVENGRRADLNAIEEAEGFDLLTELGWTADQIATASGRSKTLVAERRKLTKAPVKVKTAVEAGQVTIDDALAIAKLPPAEQTRMSKYLDKSDFRYELRRTNERIKQERAVDAEAKTLKKAGVPEKLCPAGVQNEWNLRHADHGMVRLASTGKPDRDDHDGCLVFVRAGTKQYPGIILACTAPGKHDQELNEDQLARQAERDAEEAAREQRRLEEEERQEADRVARTLRGDALMAAIKPKPALDSTLETLIRLALPDVMVQSEVAYPALFQELAGIPEDKRWETSYLEADNPWLDDLRNATGHQLLKILAAYLATCIELQLEAASKPWNDADPCDVKTAMEYFDLLTTIGHEQNTVDTDMLSRIVSTGADEDADEDVA